MHRLRAGARSVTRVLIAEKIAASGIDLLREMKARMSDVQMGWVDFWNLLAYAIGQLLFGMAGDRVGPRRIVLAGMLGSVIVALPNGTVIMNGTVSAIVAAPALNYTILVGAGGLPSQPTCTGQLTGTVTAASGPPATLSGSYSVASSTCTTPFSTGTFTLTKVNS